MDINGINSSSAISQLLTNQTSASSAAGSVPTDSNDLSPLAKLMNELQQLQQSDPDKFKSVMSDIADKLKADAQNATGSDATFLNKLASKFDQAAQTGQMPDLQFKAPSAAGGHHHHHHVQSYQEQAASSADTSATGSSSSSQQTPFSLAQVIQSALQKAGISVNT